MKIIELTAETKERVLSDLKDAGETVTNAAGFLLALDCLEISHGKKDRNTFADGGVFTDEGRDTLAKLYRNLLQLSDTDRMALEICFLKVIEKANLNLVGRIATPPELGLVLPTILRMEIHRNRSFKGRDAKRFIYMLSTCCYEEYVSHATDSEDGPFIWFAWNVAQDPKFKDRFGKIERSTWRRHFQNARKNVGKLFSMD